MSIDKSLRRKNSLQRARSVLSRGERIKVLMDTEKWKEGQSPFNLPKVRVLKISTKKPKKEKAAEGEAAAPGAAAAPAGKGAAAPAAKGAAPAAKGAAPAAKAAAPAAKAAAPAAKGKK